MADHLRFDSATGRIEPRTDNGKHTEYLLQLNDAASVQYRLGVLRTVKLFMQAIEAKPAEIAEVNKWYQEGKITQAVRDDEILFIEEELKGLVLTLQSHKGELSLPPLQKTKLNVPLTVP
jgi:hypothetical protein